jgi:hypothetical protein
LWSTAAIPLFSGAIWASARCTARQAPLAVAMPKPAAAICWKVAPLIHRDSAFCSFSGAWSCAGRDERSPPPRFDCPTVLTAPAIHTPQPRLSSFTTTDLSLALCARVRRRVDAWLVVVVGGDRSASLFVIAGLLLSGRVVAIVVGGELLQLLRIRRLLHPTGVEPPYRDKPSLRCRASSN